MCQTLPSIKRIKRIGFGFRRFRNDRLRALLCAGRPNWDLLATVTPRRNPMSRSAVRAECLTAMADGGAGDGRVVND
jgi:hypothetical protein